MMRIHHKLAQEGLLALAAIGVAASRWQQNLRSSWRHWAHHGFAVHAVCSLDWRGFFCVLMKLQTFFVVSKDSLCPHSGVFLAVFLHRLAIG